MDQFLIGCGAALGSALVFWIIWTECRLKKLSNANLLVMEKLKDDKIIARIAALSDAELNALLSDDLVTGHPKN